MTLRVLDPGLYSLIVDLGRSRTRSLGVPVGGAADRAALAIGNGLVGNAPDAAALEISLAGPTLVSHAPLAGVIYGAPFDLGSTRKLIAGTTFMLEPGEELHVGGTSTGMRAYLCVRGSIQAPVVLGSRSALQPLRAGDELPCASGSIGRRFVRVPRPWEADDFTLRVLVGAQADWFDADAFYGRTYTISPASNRMGLRLEGEPLRVPARELVSEPVCVGAVQVTRDGQCIVLGVDGQTIGGYPKIAQVISADLDRLGQARPGDAIRFQRVSLEEAELLYHRRQAVLREWLVRLRVSLDGEPFSRRRAQGPEVLPEP
jgi:antagonist of KipI